ncbi:MAG: hypothetical protein IIV00_03310 [Peptococcaceae bacterium]|nr:hypothetical protein [Peptococcaceae bacterium]
MNKKMIATAALSAFLCTGIAVPAEAAKTVTVTLPTFDVTLNGTVVENDNRQYPLLVYNDITYVPMTYYDCRFLGLETTWNQKDGLGIHKSDLTGAYYDYETAKKNSKRGTAQIATGKIKVNGKEINNATEKYPLLLYRDVTYFPLTWRFAVNEFGWKYQFDNKNGLVITSNNAHTESVIMNDVRHNEYDSFSYAVDSDYLYYEGNAGEVYRRPLNDLSNDKQRVKLAQAEEDTFYWEGFYPKINLDIVGDTLYYRYHIGGATMGGDSLYRISAENPVPERIQTRQYDTYVDYGDMQVQIPKSIIGGISADKIQITDKNGTREIGEERIVHSLCSNAYDRKNNVLYVLTGEWNEEFGGADKMYMQKLDLNTDTFYPVFDEPVYNGSYNNGEIYFVQERKNEVMVEGAPQTRYHYDLYWLNQNNSEKVLVDELNSYSAINASGVYYQDITEGNLLYWNPKEQKAVELHEKHQVTSVLNLQEYVLVCFEETPENPYRFMVFDANGKQVYTSADVIDSASISESGLLVYRLAGTTQLVKVQLQ